MIVLAVTGAHRYTHRALLDQQTYDLRLLSYNNIFRASQLSRATYIFTDLDRLSFWELELAAHLYRHLEERGARVVNDPARALHRFALLRRLKDTGFNRFNVWRAEDGVFPDRYPAFLRTQSAHRGPLSDLLNTEAAARAALDAALAQGYPLHDLMFVEYCAEPARPGVFRKLSVYRIGSKTVPSVSVHQGGWAAKLGELGAGGQELYDEEREIVRANRFGSALMPAFELAGVEYGRADFALVGGRPQVYEINTNPTISRVTNHPFPVRVESDRDCANQFNIAMAALDTPAGGSAWKIDRAPLAQQRKKDRMTARARWTA